VAAQARTVELNADALCAPSRRRLDALIQALNDGDTAPLSLPADGARDVGTWWRDHLQPMLDRELTWTQVRKKRHHASKRPRSWASSFCYSRIPTGMHGPTGIF
jgi:hypothetical protein